MKENIKLRYFSENGNCFPAQNSRVNCKKLVLQFFNSVGRKGTKVV